MVARLGRALSSVVERYIGIVEAAGAIPAASIKQSWRNPWQKIIKFVLDLCAAWGCNGKIKLERFV